MRRRLVWVLGALLAAGALVGGAAARSRPTSHAVAVRHAREAAARLDGGAVLVHTPDGDIHTDAASVDLVVDEAATAAAAEHEGRWGRLWPGDPPVVATVDRRKVRNIVAVHDPTGRRPAVEPSVTVDDDGRFVIRGGRAGHGLDAAEVADAIVAGARHAGRSVEADVDAVPLPPQLSRAAAVRAVAVARRRTAAPLEVSIGDEQRELSSTTMRRWLTTRPSGRRLDVVVDGKEAAGDLADLFPDAGTKPADATFAVVGDTTVLTPAVDGTTCCAASVGDVLTDALRHRPPTTVELPLRHEPADRTDTEAVALGIHELVGEFTTRHVCCQSRVTNIHRIADLLRGTIIEPGKSLSINDTVGKRTTEKGFVVAPTIENGLHDTDVGGGVSQFATTLFNAAFFAGLDLPEYQSHSLYISRYPYGREATLSWPKPDLVIRNGTPYGVLVWTSYTSRSLTVSLWSTKTVTGEQTGQTRTPSGNCTRVRTERTRTYVDGRTSVDAVFATYRPKEGVNC